MNMICHWLLVLPRTPVTAHTAHLPLRIAAQLGTAQLREPPERNGLRVAGIDRRPRVGHLRSLRTQLPEARLALYRSMTDWVMSTASSANTRPDWNLLNISV